MIGNVKEYEEINTKMLEIRFHQECFSNSSVLSIDEEVVRFRDSPDAGDNCLCSLCLQPIGEDEVPIRVFEELEQ